MADETDSDESETEYGQRVLAYDPDQLTGGDGVPSNGHDYLRMVEQERLKLPNCSQAPRSKAKEDSNKLIREVSEANRKTVIDIKDDKSEPFHLNIILKNFKLLKDKISGLRGQSTSLNTDCPSDKIVNQDGLVEASSKVVNEVMQQISAGHAPLTRFIINKSQLELHMTLERIAEMCEITPNNTTLDSEWVYCIMAALREPIDADICSTLRRLAKICIKRRLAYEKQNLDDLKDYQKEEFHSTLLIITLVRHHFGQKDIKLAPK